MKHISLHKFHVSNGIFFMGFVLIFLPMATRAQDSIASDNDYWIERFNEEYNAERYQQAYQLLDSIDFSEPISGLTLLNSANCIINVGKYNECINFCNAYSKFHSDDGFDSSIFDVCYGESYYYLEDWSMADPYFESYMKYADSSKLSLGLYYMVLYANTLHKLHHYDKAKVMYERLLAQAKDEEKYRPDNPFLTDNLCSLALYYYAYNTIFQGDEINGAKILEMASKCGNEKAKKDWAALSASPTFNKSLAVKNSVINNFDKMIENYNFSRDSLGKADDIEPAYFWYRLQQTNVTYNELEAALKRPSKPKTLEKAINYMNKNQSLLEASLVKCSPYKTGEIEKGLDSLICGSKSFFKEIRVYPAEQPNAFATPYGEIYLTEALVRRMNFNNDLLMGICAHEAAHYFLQHSLSAKWKQEKKEKSSKIWGGIAAGLYAVAQGAETMYGASNGVTYDQNYYDNMASTTTDLYDSFQKDAYYFQFKYSRSQELEADLAAYRFCETMGVGGYSYIVALELLGNEDSSVKVEKEDSHPTIAYRVNLLKHLYEIEHPKK